MTQNEVDIIKNSVIDATEAYVEARLAVLDFVRTQIGVVIEEPIKGNDRKYRHKVRCNKTTNTDGITYNNVLSVGNIPFPMNSVVFLIAPNAQYSNQFILGKLDDTPCNISAGSITLGDAIYLTSTPIGGVYGHIGGFNIYEDKLVVGDAILSPNIIGCGTAGLGLLNLVGGSEATGQKGYIQISDSGDPNNCIDGYRIYWDGEIEYWKGVQQGDEIVPSYQWSKYIVNIPDDSFGAMLTRYIEADGTGYLRWKSN